MPLTPGDVFQRAVDRLGDPGARRGRPRPYADPPRRRPLTAVVPALAAKLDGAVRYSRTSRQTPVWVTAQALTGLDASPFSVTIGAQSGGRK